MDSSETSASKAPLVVCVSYHECQPKPYHVLVPRPKACCVHKFIIWLISAHATLSALFIDEIAPTVMARVGKVLTPTVMTHSHSHFVHADYYVGVGFESM